MGRKIWALVLLVTLVTIGVYNWQYQRWGRQIIYPDNSTQTKYPGLGKRVGYVEAQVYVNPRGEGRPFYVTEVEEQQYPDESYEKIYFPAQVVWAYATGRVVGWEEISGSNDKYLLLDEGAGKIEKYRIGYDHSLLFEDNGRASGTLLGIENTAWRRGEGVNELQNYSTLQVSELGSEVVEKMIKVGDSVVVSPVFAPPKYVATDEQGVATALWLILRRIGGDL